jgi:hypothetical protein
MTIQDNIVQVVLQAKCTAVCMMDNALKQQKGGDNVDCCYKKISLLTKWIDILEHYYCNVYQLSVDPCITEAKMLNLLGKVGIMIKNC